MHEAIILAGGLGTRLQNVVNNLPKAMAPVNDRPFLEYLLDYLLSYETKKVVLSVGYRYQTIMDHFGSQYKGMEIDYAIEKEPLGTGGGLRLALEKCSEKDVLALNGDTLFLIDLFDFRKRYQQHAVSISIALRKVQNASRYGSVRVNRNKTITAFGEKSDKRASGLINGGIYMLNRQFFLSNTGNGSFSLEKDCFEQWYPESHLSGFVYDAYFLDIGLPDDYLKAQNEFTKLAY
jgi:D-glycero-alpha-D-manno-heptose 1-phosphate guanylyltransferase